MDKRQVDGTIRFDRNRSLAAANKSGKRIGKLLDLFIEGNDMNRDEPVISKLPRVSCLLNILASRNFFSIFLASWSGGQGLRPGPPR